MICIVALPSLIAARGPRSGNEWLLFVAIIGVFILIAVISSLREKRRTRLLATAAPELGFAFAYTDSTLTDELSQFRLFSIGRNKEVKNVMSGAGDGTEFVVFDYKYRTGSGKNSSNHRQTVLLMRRPDWRFTQFELRPETLFTKLGQMLGKEDINFEGHPEFSRQYHLRGPDDEAIRRLFGGKLLAHLESNPGLCIEAAGRCVILYRWGKRIAPAEIGPLVDRARDLHDALSAGVV
jgi:hypothetical protein